MSLRMQLGDRGRLILVATVAAVVVLLVIGAGIVLIPHEYRDRIPGKWVRFSAVTLLFGYYALTMYRKLWRSATFWAIFLCTLTFHVLGIGYFFYVADGLSLATLALAGGGEIACMGLVVYWTLRVGPSLRPRHSSGWTPSI